MDILRAFRSFFMLILFFMFFPLIPVLTKNLKTFYFRHFDPRTQVAVVPIRGFLYDSAYLTKHIRRFFENNDIKAILLKIECPGGASGTGQAIFSEIRHFKKIYPTKPVIALVENICASGGYYVASAADYIIAPPSALIGSIGARFGYLFQLQELLQDYKIQYKAIKAGTYKNVADPFVGITEQEVAMLQSVLDDTYQQFIVDISQQRKLAPTQSYEWADGKIFTARQAKKLGLIDQLGSISVAKKVIKEKALIETNIKWVKPPQKSGWFNLISSDSSDDNDELSSNLVNAICATLENRYLKKIIY
ncbi:signal peptide peptidase SppA [Candidatus Dependentiae bacterium]|nr:signal peptide peptidase SppA [Candidatus Dependentiae bacterium]